MLEHEMLSASARFDLDLECAGGRGGCGRVHVEILKRTEGRTEAM